ncbi:hypothetical protein BKA69DRAFT_1098298 [Paraphysoderma sedebokerense]|nr:hypothetical protein BKA69DRAFT_1098232 [Paraphysoderma sedebokerense]KAI9137389.1 hypothetical protein BKA69DRAFT_1098298 [Paraphysoderma sedebokerense]
MTLISTDDTLATDELEYGFKPPEDFESIETPITNIRYPYVEDDDKELWLIRVANNLPLSVLNNMKIQLPTVSVYRAFQITKVIWLL